MSLTLDMVKNKLPDMAGQVIFINQWTLNVYNNSGLPIGCLYQDKTRCIYESYTYDNGMHELENVEFLSYFKRKHLLTIKIGAYIRCIYILQEIIK